MEQFVGMSSTQHIRGCYLHGHWYTTLHHPSNLIYVDSPTYGCEETGPEPVVLWIVLDRLHHAVLEVGPKMTLSTLDIDELLLIQYTVRKAFSMKLIYHTVRPPSKCLFEYSFPTSRLVAWSFNVALCITHPALLNSPSPQTEYSKSVINAREHTWALNCTYSSTCPALIRW